VPPAARRGRTDGPRPARRLRAVDGDLRRAGVRPRARRPAPGPFAARRRRHRGPVPGVGRGGGRGVRRRGARPRRRRRDREPQPDPAAGWWGGGPARRLSRALGSTACRAPWTPSRSRCARSALTIRRARPEDAAAIWAYRRLEPVARFMTALPGPLEDFRTTFTEPDRLGRALVVELVDGTLVGDLMVRVDDAWAQTEVAAQAAGTQAEIGRALDPAHQGHGYATEAVRELLRLCFDDLGLRRVVALCFAANEPSWRLMERVGM